MASTASIREIDCAIVFLMAEWSGPAQWAWRQLSDFVQSYTGPKPNIIKIEWQDTASVQNLPELEGKIHANGEAMVVKDGKIVFFTVLGREKAQVQSRCQELLAAYEERNGV
jgi:hypothetical protein